MIAADRDLDPAVAQVRHPHLLGAVGGDDAAPVIADPEAAEAAVRLADGEQAALVAVEGLDRAGPREGLGLAAAALDPPVGLAGRGRGGAVGGLVLGLARAGGEKQQGGERGAHGPSYHFRRSASSRSAERRAGDQGIEQRVLLGVAAASPRRRARCRA